MYGRTTPSLCLGTLVPRQKVCEFVCIRACTCECVYVGVRMCVYVCVCVYVDVCMCVYVCVCVCQSVVCLYVFMHVVYSMWIGVVCECSLHPLHATHMYAHTHINAHT